MTADFSQIDIEFKDNIKEIEYLECPICIDKFNKPVIVQCCGNSFCSKCLHIHLNSNSQCPICRTVISTKNIKPNTLLELVFPPYNEIDMNEIIKWKSTLSKVETYIIKENKVPSYTFNIDSDIRELGYWLGTQDLWYKKRWYIMKLEEIRNLWKNFNEKYIILSDIDKWKYVMKEVEKYVKDYKKLPSYSEDIYTYHKELGWWLGTQKFWYQKKWYIMKNLEIRNLWEKFIKENHI